jgi:hypothetical protein
MKIKEIHLLAFYVARPRNPKMTHIKGYMKDPANIQYDERIEITRGLHGKDQQYAGIVLNLNQKKVVYNKFDTDQRDFDTLFKYFLEGYPQYVIQVMAQLDVQYLEQFIPREEQTEAEATAPEVTSETVQAE